MRVFLLVLDSFGIGEAPDAHLYNDEGSNTFKSVTENKFCKIPTLTKLGLTNIDGINSTNKDYIAKIVRLEELSKGKDADIVVFDDDINIESVFVMGDNVK